MIIKLSYKGHVRRLRSEPTFDGVEDTFFSLYPSALEKTVRFVVKKQDLQTEQDLAITTEEHFQTAVKIFQKNGRKSLKIFVEEWDCESPNAEDAEDAEKTISFHPWKDQHQQEPSVSESSLPELVPLPVVIDNEKDDEVQHQSQEEGVNRTRTSHSSSFCDDIPDLVPVEPRKRKISDLPLLDEVPIGASPLGDFWNADDRPPRPYTTIHIGVDADTGAAKVERRNEWAEAKGKADTDAPKEERRNGNFGDLDSWFLSPFIVPQSQPQEQEQEQSASEASVDDGQVHSEQEDHVEQEASSEQEDRVESEAPSSSIPHLEGHEDEALQAFVPEAEESAEGNHLILQPSAPAEAVLEVNEGPVDDLNPQEEPVDAQQEEEPAVEDGGNEEWVCPRCTLVNLITDRQCIACTMLRSGLACPPLSKDLPDLVKMEQEEQKEEDPFCTSGKVKSPDSNGRGLPGLLRTVNSVKNKVVNAFYGPSEDESKELEREKYDMKPQPGHFFVQCDKCFQEIFGIRFKCYVCENYNLCEDCDYVDQHDSLHPFIRIITPSQDPNRGVLALRKEADQKEDDMAPIYSVDLVSQLGFGSKQTYEPSTDIVVGWRLKNTGFDPLAPGTSVEPVEGEGWNCDDIVCPDIIQMPPLGPNEEMEIRINITTPPNIGTYLSTWQLTTPPTKGEDKKRFGDKLHLKLDVVSPFSKDEEAKLLALHEMGFTNRAQNVNSLIAVGWQLDRVIQKLVQPQP